MVRAWPLPMSLSAVGFRSTLGALFSDKCRVFLLILGYCFDVVSSSIALYALAHMLHLIQV